MSSKVHLVKAIIFPGVMYGCESWTIKKAECWRIDAFELSCWKRLLRVPWTARISNQSILKQKSPGCSLEGLMLKMKLQYFGHLIQRTDSFEKTLMLGKIKGRRRRRQQRMRWLDGITDYMDIRFSAAHGVAKHQTWLNDLTTTTIRSSIVVWTVGRGYFIAKVIVMWEKFQNWSFKLNQYTISLNK